MKKAAVAYLRRSSSRHGAGLQLEEQRNDVTAFCDANDYRILPEGEFIEDEPPRLTDRPRLRAALTRAKASRALLVIPRVDRLWHDADFIAPLRDSAVDFRALDVPTLNQLPLSVVLAAAEEEARALSARTKAALAAAAAAGVLLGAHNPACRNLAAGAGRRGALTSRVVRRLRRDGVIAAVGRKIKALRAEGYSYGTIAAVLNDDGDATATGARWGAKSVWRAARQIA